MKQRLKRQRSIICPKCQDKDEMPLEFDSWEKFHEHTKKYHSQIVDKSQLSTKEKPELPTKKELRIEQLEPVIHKKPELIYKYIGQCPNCKNEVDTIPLDLDARTKNQVIVCWCNNCKKKLAQREVVKL